MLRNALRIAATLALVGLGYAGYDRGFAAVARLVETKAGAPPVSLSGEPSAGLKVATQQALRAFGKDHWSAGAGGQVFRYYDAPRGFWMYFSEYTPLDGNKRIKFTPFAMLWQTGGDPALKSLSADEAVVEFDKPMEPGKPGSGHIIWARISGGVVIRNDKGTPAKAADDMMIGPVDYLTFEEKALQITSPCPIVVRDENIKAVGVGLVVSLEPKLPGLGGGFDPRAVRLEKDVRIDLAEVRGSGVVPGGAEGPADPSKAAPAARPGEAPKPKPGVITCLGPMDIFLPPNRRPARIGPPAPKGPTRAEFRRRVEAKQGLELPDQLNSDFLELTFVEPDRPAAASATPKGPGAADPAAPAPAAGAPARGDGLGGLTLVAAKATGYAVWLQSPSQGTKALGNEMIYHRALPPTRPGEPKADDVTYFRADQVVKAEKLTLFGDGPNKGKVQSIDEFRATDVTIYQSGPEIPPTIVARGPGTMETRPDRGRPIERTAEWSDRLDVLNVGVGPDARRKIILTGNPRVTAPGQADIKALDTIIAMLRPKAKTTAGAEVLIDGRPQAVPGASGPAANPAGGGMEIEWASAHNQVHMVTWSDPEKGRAPGTPGPRRAPSMNVLDAEKSLDATFVQAPARPKAPKPAPAPVVAAAPVAAAAAPAPKVEEPEILPPKPPMIARAEKVWARILMSPEDEADAAARAKADGPSGLGSTRSELEWARLRGGVTIHQDPAEGKARGTDVAADAVDVENRGEDKALIRALGVPGQPAVAVTEGFTISGPLLGMNQAIDFAWVDGPGTLVQEPAVARADDPDRGDPTRDDAVLDAGAAVGADGAVRPAPAPGARAEDAKGEPAGKAAAKKKPADRGRLTITWRKEMDFYGHTVGDDGELGPARAEFYEAVRARDDQNNVACETMIAMLDGPVSFHRRAGHDDPRDPARETGKGPDAKINWVHCLSKPAKDAPPRPGLAKLYGVEIVQREVDADSHALVGARRIRGDDVIFDKLHGKFDVLGDGLVFLYAPADSKAPGSRPGEPGRTPGPAPMPVDRMASPRTVRPVSDGPRPTPPPPDVRGDAEPDRPRAKAAAKRATGKKKADEPMPWNLTQIRFSKRMQGTFDGSSLDGAAPATPKDPKDAKAAPKKPNQADFWGGVRVLHAPVKDTDAELDPDAEFPPKGEFRLSCRTLRVDEIPSPDGDKAKARRLITGWEEVILKEEDAHRVIKGETLTYDSQKELYWVYGAPTRPATYADLARTGTAGSSASGQAFMVNRETGQYQVVNPGSLVLADPRTGGRYAPAAPDEILDPKDKRKNFRMPSRADKERRGFSGR